MTRNSGPGKGRSVRERALLPTLVMLASSQSVVSSLGAPLVPRIAAEQGVSLSAAQWILTITFLAGAVCTPIVGRVGSGRHRRPVVLGGLVVVVLGCVLSALPLGFEAMLIGRALQGFGLSLTPLAIAVAWEFIPAGRRAGAIAALSVTVVTASGLGFPLAAYVVTHVDVAAAYWCGAALCSVTLLACVLVVPGGAEDNHQPVDLPGAVLLGCGAAALLLVVSQVHDWGGASLTTMLVTVTALALLTGWVMWTLHAPQPLVDLRLAVRHGVLGANVTAVLAGCGMYTVVTSVVLLVQAPVGTGEGLGQSVTWAGLMLVPFSIASVVGSWAGRRLARRIGPDQQLSLGAVWAGLGAIWLTLLRDELWQVAVGMAVCGLGNGYVFAAMPGLIVRFVPIRETGSAMSFNQILRYLGLSTGSALVVTVLEIASEGDAITDGGFTAAFLVASGICGATAVIAFWLGRSIPRTSGEPGPDAGEEPERFAIDAGRP